MSSPRRSLPIVVSLACSLFINQSDAQSRQHVITVYGPRAGVHATASKYHANSHSIYQIQAGMFSNKRNAVLYRNKLAHKVRAKVRVERVPKSKGMYQVMIGPVSSVAAVHQISQQLLARHHAVRAKPLHQPHVVKRVVSVHKPVHKPVQQASHAQSHVATRWQLSPGYQASSRHALQPQYNLKPENANKQPMNFTDGPYLGISVGVRQNFSSAPAAYTGIEGILSAGYGHLWKQKMYLAGEIFGGNSAEVKNYPAKITNNSIRTNWNFGGDIIPGFMLTKQVLGYLRLGIVDANFNDMHTHATGWRVGVGGETNLCRLLDLRAEYIFSAYEPITGLGGRPQSNLFNIGFVTKFR